MQFNPDELHQKEIYKLLTGLGINNVGKSTAIYKFEENSKLPFLDEHKLFDEHIFVISGVFNDGNKKYKEGSFIINPKGTSHIPQSEEECTILVTNE